MTDLLIARDLLLSLCIGLLIGIERGWRTRAEASGSRVAGVRTFGLLGALGGMAGVLGRSNVLLPAVLMAAGAAPLVIAYFRESRSAHSVSATTTIAGVITLALGALATGQHPAIAFACAALVTLVLASKRQLHRMIGTLGEGDVQAVARFAIVAGAVLPFLPNRYYGPLQAWNPFQLWFVVVLVTGFSFAAYVANKLVGERRGTLATAAIGGMYSSTVVTVALARRLHEEAEDERTLSAGIALATAIMFVRVLVLTGVLAGFALLPFAKVIGPAAVIAILFCGWLIRSASSSGGNAEVQSTNPFALIPAIGFALLVGAMALGARWAKLEFGNAGVSILLAITGAFDVDAAIVTLHGLGAKAIEPGLVGVVLAIPVALNTAFKAVIVLVYAGWRRGARAAIALASSALAIAAVAIIDVLMQV